MKKSSENPRWDLARESAVFQLKLLTDGLRDAVLIPISLLATLIGLIRGGKDCDKELNEVLRLGRKSERWINLFGHQRALGFTHPAGSMDRVLNQVEAIVIDQYKKGKSAAETRSAVRRAFEEEGFDTDQEADGKPPQ